MEVGAFLILAFSGKRAGILGSQEGHKAVKGAQRPEFGPLLNIHEVGCTAERQRA